MTDTYGEAVSRDSQGGGQRHRGEVLPLQVEGEGIVNLTGEEYQKRATSCLIVGVRGETFLERCFSFRLTGQLQGQKHPGQSRLSQTSER